MTGDKVQIDNQPIAGSSWKRSSRGIVVAPIVEILFGTYAFIGSVVHDFFGIGGLFSFSGQDYPLGPIPHPLGHTFALEGLILLVAGVGLLKARKWGWSLSVGITTAGIITSILALGIGSVGAVQPLAVNLGVLYYLSRRSVRDAVSG